MIVNAKNYTYSELNKVINKYKTLTISGVLGERHVATGAGGGTVTIEGVPGNALASYLNGATVIVKGDVQDAVGEGDGHLGAERLGDRALGALDGDYVPLGDGDFHAGGDGDGFSSYSRHLSALLTTRTRGLRRQHALCEPACRS